MSNFVTYLGAGLPFLISWLFFSNYLAAVLDLARRKIIGWSLGTLPTAKLANKALTRALAKEKSKDSLIHHSDRGSQYKAKEYKALPAEHKIVSSMSRKGNSYDNAPMESFFRLLKVEHVYKWSFFTIEQAASILQNGLIIIMPKDDIVLWVVFPR